MEEKINIGYNRKLFFLDSFFVFINISNSFSIIPYLLFFPNRAINTGIITIINVIYIFLRFKNKITLPLRDSLFLLYFVLNVTNTFFGLYTDTLGWGVFPYLFSNTTFYIILINLFMCYQRSFSFEGSVYMITRSYIFLCLINIVSVLSLFFLIQVFDFYPLVNDVGDKIDLFKGNIDRNPENVAYYFPLSLSIFCKSLDIRIPMLQPYGIICGFYHEPHIITFLVAPSIFLILNKIKIIFWKVLVIVIYILFMLIEASTTNVLAMLACLGVLMIQRLRKNVILPIVFLLAVGCLFLFIDDSLYAFVFYKLNSNSADYSLTTIQFAFEPKTWLGTSFYDLSYLHTTTKLYDVGYINFFFNLLFLVVFIYKIFRLNMAKNMNITWIGLFALYFFLHSLKLAMATYSLSYLLLIVFLINIYSSKMYSVVRN